MPGLPLFWRGNEGEVATRLMVITLTSPPFLLSKREEAVQYHFNKRLFFHFVIGSLINALYESLNIVKGWLKVDS